MYFTILHSILFSFSLKYPNKQKTLGYRGKLSIFNHITLNRFVNVKTCLTQLTGGVQFKLNWFWFWTHFVDSIELIREKESLNSTARKSKKTDVILHWIQPTPSLFVIINYGLLILYRKPVINYNESWCVWWLQIGEKVPIKADTIGRITNNSQRVLYKLMKTNNLNSSAFIRNQNYLSSYVH